MVGEPRNLQYTAAGGKLFATDRDRGITFICRATRVAMNEKLHTTEIHMNLVLLQVILQEPQWNTAGMLAMSELLSTRGVEVTLQHA
jgi:hypothetical protein